MPSLKGRDYPSPWRCEDPWASSLGSKKGTGAERVGGWRSLQRESPWEAVEDGPGTQVEELKQVEQVEDSRSSFCIDGDGQVTSACREPLSSPRRSER